MEEIKEAPVPGIGTIVLFEFSGDWVPATVLKVARVDYYQHLPDKRMGVYLDLEVEFTNDKHPDVRVQEADPHTIHILVKGVGWSDNKDHVGMWRLP